MSAEQLKRLGVMNIVAVLADDGALITASHRTRRLLNDWVPALSVTPSLPTRISSNP